MITFTTALAILIITPVSLKVESPQELLRQGRFTEAKSAANKLLQRDSKNMNVLEVLVRVLLLENQAQKALDLLNRNTDLVMKNKTMAGLRATAEYRLGKYELASKSLKAADEPQRAKQMDSFGKSRPYTLRLPKAKTSIPFIQTNPMPLLELKVNGKVGNFLLDTGANELILDPEFAKAVQVSAVSHRKGTFAAGKASEVGLAKANVLNLGQATLTHVPVNILDTGRFSVVAGGRDVHGILGMGVLRQFHATIDYTKGEIILAPALPLGATKVGSVPMWLAGDHIVLVEGSAKGKKGLFFVDTGLAGLAFAPSTHYAKLCGIETSGNQIQGVGGAGSVRVTPFSCPELRIGQVSKSGTMGVVGAFPPSLQSAYGCEISAIISHQFFSQTSVAFDFVNMRLLVTSKPK